MWLQGAACTIFAATLAASIAFTVAQGIGRKIAERIIDGEVGGESSGEKGNAAQQALARVQASVEKGGFWQQYSAVLALRMTPVVPFRYTPRDRSCCTPASSSFSLCRVWDGPPVHLCRDAWTAAGFGLTSLLTTFHPSLVPKKLNVYCLYEFNMDAVTGVLLSYSVFFSKDDPWVHQNTEKHLRFAILSLSNIS